MSEQDEFTFEITLFGDSATEAWLRILSEIDPVTNEVSMDTEGAALGLHCYYEILAKERCQLKNIFDNGEKCLMLQVGFSHGLWISMDQQIWGFIASLEDNIIYYNLDQSWGVDGQKLIQKIRSLSFPSQVALLDTLSYCSNRLKPSVFDLDELFDFGPEWVKNNPRSIQPTFDSNHKIIG